MSPSNALRFCAAEPSNLDINPSKCFHESRYLSHVLGIVHKVSGTGSSISCSLAAIRLNPRHDPALMALHSPTLLTPDQMLPWTCSTPKYLSSGWAGLGPAIPLLSLCEGVTDRFDSFKRVLSQADAALLHSTKGREVRQSGKYCGCVTTEEPYAEVAPSRTRRRSGSNKGKWPLATYYSFCLGEVERVTAILEHFGWERCEGLWTICGSPL